MTIEINTDVVTSGRRKIRALRWWMLALFLLGVTVNYITRNSLGLLAAELKTSLNMTTEQYSYIVAAFQGGLHHFPTAVWLAD
ncbi:sugar phosphate permease [Ewingella americana]